MEKEMFDTEQYNYPMVVVRQHAGGKWECLCFSAATDAARWMRGDDGDGAWDDFGTALAADMRTYDIYTEAEAMERVADEWWDREVRWEIATFVNPGGQAAQS